MGESAEEACALAKRVERQARAARVEALEVRERARLLAERLRRSAVRARGSR